MSIPEHSELGWAPISEVDPDLWSAMVRERARQHDKIELIASENYAFAAVMEAQGSWLTNKYAEGLPGRRYYGGCEFVDVVEDLARERALALFQGAEHANVQPHSGAQANMAAYFAVLEVGDPILGMNLAQGGHLTHGSPVNFSGRWLAAHAYGVDPTSERIDMAHFAGLVAGGVHPSPFPHADLVTSTTHKTLRSARGGMVLCRADLPDRIDRDRFSTVKGTLAAAVDKAVFPLLQGGPLEHVIAGKAVGFHLAATETFRDDQRRTIGNAAVIADALASGGARVVSGGTDNHLVLVDVRPLGTTGREAEAILDGIGITVNKNAIPYDPAPPNSPSGIRIGTPATTTRGFGPDEMRAIGRLVVDAIRSRDDPTRLGRLAGEVAEMVARFPVPGLARA